MSSHTPLRQISKSSQLLRKLLLGAVFSTAGLMAADLSSVRHLYLDQSLRPDPRSVAAFDLSVLHPQAKVDMEPGHALGNRYLALLDIVHYQTGTRAAMLAAERLMASKPSATDPRGRLADLAHPEWIPWVVESLADPAAKKGFDGFVLSLGGEASSPASREALLKLAATLRQRFPDKRLLLDLRSGLGSEAVRVADGFLALGVYTRESRTGGLDWTPIAEVQRLTRHIRSVQMQGMRVFAVDYAPAKDRSAAREAAQRLTSIGALPFITTPAMSGVNLGPLEEISRRVLVLHGWDAKHTGQAAPAAESTATALFMRPALEWLGCELDFCSANGPDFLPASLDFSAVVLDSGLVLNDAQQRSLAAWLPSLRAKKIPLLLTSMPFTDETARQQALLHLDLGGSAKPVSRLVKASVAGIDSTLIGAGSRIQGRALGFLNLTAPTDSRVVLAIRGEDALDTEHRFDQAFLATWGGACIDPMLGTTGPQVDLPAFLAAWLGSDRSAPVPDTTTRDGRRVFYSHIESTGFSTPSTLPGFPLCAEVMRDRILDRYLLPVTVSVCEADLRCWFPGQQGEAALRLEHTARSIFEMLQVQAASNSFTRPSTWTAGTDIAAKLNDRAQTARHDMEREIAGSMNYIHRRLLPVGKDVNLMLWPQNAAPTPEALRFCESMSIENLPAAPIGTPAAVLDSKSVRLEPVAVRSRFENVRTEQGIATLEKNLDACAAAPLHAMTAAAYAASVRDARHTRILRAAENHWIILNQGECRTLRLPASVGVPDMTRCIGVSGFNTHAGQLYIHTLGGARTELVLTREKAARHIHLVESSAPVEFMDLSSRRATFHVRDLRPVEVVFGGFEPRGQCAYLENGRPYTVNADANGIVRLELVCRATVSIQSLPPSVEAAMR
jgi:polysaccharide biosynthesis protein PelA